MPELPEVEIVRRGLNQTTRDHVIQGGEVLLSRSIAHPDSIVEFLQGIQNTRIEAWSRRGKYLLATLINEKGDAAGHLGVHLRMTGQLLWLPSETPVSQHCRVRFWFEGDRELRFVDQRTFGRIWWMAAEAMPEQIMVGMGRLGPEPLSADFTAAYLYRVTRKRQRPIKNALLDQALIAGLGNIYADESLFLSGIHPTTLCSQLGKTRIERLHNAIQTVLTNAIAHGGTTFSDFRNVQGVNGNYGGMAAVYHREGQPCPTCQTPIQRLKLAGRSSHYCPHCQR